MRNHGFWHVYYFRVVGFLIATSMLGGCGVMPQSQFEGKLFERAGVSMVVAPADARETYFSDVKSLERHCRAPSPDVSVTASEGFGFSLPLPKLTGAEPDVGADEQQGALSLGGRDPAVLIARELMYRACELSNNLNLSAADTLKVYERFLQSIEKIAAVQTGAGVSSLAATAGDSRVTLPGAAPKPDASSSADSKSSDADGSGDDSSDAGPPDSNAGS